MEYWRRLLILLTIAVCLLLASAICEGKPQSHQRVCSVTKGNMLRSFLKAKGRVHLPCRYIVGEFHCPTRTRVIAHNSRARDGKTFVSAVTLRKSRADQAIDNDEISVNMDDIEQFLEEQHGEKQSGPLTDQGHLHAIFDTETGQAVLGDDVGRLHVHLEFVDRAKGKAKLGNLSIVCSDPNMKGVLSSPSYLCGNVGNSFKEADSKKHLRLAAKQVELSTDDYITYTILMYHNEQQTDSLCQEAFDVTRSCKDVKAAVRECGRLLNPRSYRGKWLRIGTVFPLSVFVNCVKWQCTRDWNACVQLGNVLKICEKGGKVYKKLPCVTSGGGYIY